MVGILVSFWDALFSGAMLVSGSVKQILTEYYPLFQNIQVCEWRCDAMLLRLSSSNFWGPFVWSAILQLSDFGS